MTTKTRRGGAVPKDLFADVSALRQHMTAGMEGSLGVLMELELSLAQSMALVKLAERGPMTITELQGAVSRSQAGTSQLVEQLEQRGLVAREIDPQDRRRRVVALASKGREVVRRIEAVRRQAVDSVLGRVPAPVLARFHAALRDVLQALED